MTDKTISDKFGSPMPEPELTAKVAGLLAEMPTPGLGGYAAMWRQFSGSDYFRNAASGAGYQNPGYYLRMAGRGQAARPASVVPAVPGTTLGGTIPAYTAPPTNPAAPAVPFPVDQTPGARGGDPAATPLGALMKALGALANPGSVIIEPTNNNIITGPARLGRYGPQ